MIGGIKEEIGIVLGEDTEVPANRIDPAVGAYQWEWPLPLRSGPDRMFRRH